MASGHEIPFRCASLAGGDLPGGDLDTRPGPGRVPRSPGWPGPSSRRLFNGAGDARRARMIYGNPAVSLTEDGDLRVIKLRGGSAVHSRAVIIALACPAGAWESPPSSHWPAGVSYGASTAEAPTVADTQAFVVGGGNSAGQAALHLSKYAMPLTQGLPEQIGRDQRGSSSPGRTQARAGHCHGLRSCWKPACPKCSRSATPGAATSRRRLLFGWPRDDQG